MTQERNFRDYPLERMAAEAQELFAKGYDVYQKFTCIQCGSRQTMAEPNRFFTSGLCEACGAETDIKEHGCGYLILMNLKRSQP